MKSYKVKCLCGKWLTRRNVTRGRARCFSCRRELVRQTALKQRKNVYTYKTIIECAILSVLDKE